MLVSNPRDKIDAWLDADVEPLAPLPGSFDQIRKRARRRKAAGAIASAAGAVVVIVAIAAVPHLVRTLRPGTPSPVAGRSVPVVLPSPVRPTLGRSKGGGTPASHSSTRVARSSTS